jgi:hypothetical protein
MDGEDGMGRVKWREMGWDGWMIWGALALVDAARKLSYFPGNGG